MDSQETETWMNLVERAQQQYRQNLPFVVYSKPKSKKVVGIFQKDNFLYLTRDFEEKGFVFAPFDGDAVVLLPLEKSQVLVTDIDFAIPKQQRKGIAIKDQDVAKSSHMFLVQKAIDAIETGAFKKLVVSRKENISVANLEFTDLFKKLLQNYPTAFSYCFYHPKVGMWLGGFSEQLVKIKEQVLNTMAVAGTQVYQENSATVWESKEKAEQQFVTDFILDRLKNHVTDWTISEPYTMKAGNVVHLKTAIQGELKPSSHLKDILAILHPTPAVCGLPKLESKAFLLQNEGYDREYYSGYLGELNHDFISQEKATELNVNLRCLKVESNSETNTTIHLYVGGGITKDSVAEKEWEETVQKANTMKALLD